MENSMAERALATVRSVSDVRPIPGADNIEVATVDGWEVIVGKGEFQAGDLGVYMEPDSFLPVKPEYEFLRKSSYRKLVDGAEGFRLKTIKMRGQLSQGLLIPLSKIMANNPEVDVSGAVILHDGDVTDILGISLWNPPLPVSMRGNAKGNFPTHLVPKTDEPRIQNCTRSLDDMRQAKEWYGREKLDGMSITMYFDGENFGVCSRNLEMKEEKSNPAWKIAREHKVEEHLREFGRPVALQGELIGPGIQKNPYKLSSPEWWLFSIYDIGKKAYSSDIVLLFHAEELGLNICPLIYVEDFLPATTKEILQMSEIKSALLSSTEAEGIVWRHCKEGKRVYSFKAINNNYLLKDKD